jgi:hypothetical protein
MFGTFEPEVEKVDYGIVRQIRSYNFLVLNFHEFVDMLRDVMAPGPLSQRLKHLWMPPDWERPGHARIHTWTVGRKGHERAVSRRVEERDIVRSSAAEADPAVTRNLH